MAANGGLCTFGRPATGFYFYRGWFGRVLFVILKFCWGVGVEGLEGCVFVLHEEGLELWKLITSEMMKMDTQGSKLKRPMDPKKNKKGSPWVPFLTARLEQSIQPLYILCSLL